MVKTKKISLIILSIVFIVLMALGGYFFSSFFKVNAEEPIPAEEYTQTGSYVLNTSYELPKRSYTLDGETKEAKTVLVSPTEIAYDGERVVLNETGVWTLEFSVSFNKKYYVFTEEFTVNRYTYEVSSGSISTGRSSMFPSSGEGLLIQLNRNAEFRYNEVIDLTGKTLKDNIIEFGLMPSSIGVAEVSEVRIKLTDIYDENNHITIIALNPNNEAANTYIGRGSLAATFTGQDVWLGHQKTYKDGSHFIHSNSLYYGAYTKLSFDGIVPSTASYVEGITQISYDYAEKEVHSKTKHWYESASGKYTTLVADLDDLNYANAKINAKGTGKGFSEAFKGFTTGEVYLSISCTGYTGDTCGVFIKSICDADFSQVKSYDDSAPLLTVDTEEYDINALPLAEVGRAYKIFNATARDNETVINPSIKVYYMRGSSKLSRVSIVNGMFIPAMKGTYCIEYSAVDGSGNQAMKTIYVNAVEDVALPEVQFVGNYLQKAFVGETIELATVANNTYSGNAAVRIQVWCNEEIITENEAKFVAQKEGVYIVKAVAMDYIGQEQSATYSIEITRSENPIIVNEPVLPNVLIDGTTYSLPIVLAKDYYSAVDGEDIISQITVIDGSGTKVLSDGEFKAQAGDKSSAIIRYDFISESGESYLEYEVPIIKVGNLETDLVNYFVSEGDCEVTQLKESILLSYQESCFVNFAKSIPLLNTRFVFRIYNDGSVLYDNGMGIEIVLTDTLNKAQQIKISLTVDKSSEVEYYNLSINDGKKYIVAGDFYTVKQIEFYYNNINGYVKVGSNIIYLNEILSTEQFNGFTNEQAYLSIRGLGIDPTIDKSFGVEVVRIGSQTFAKTDGDYIAPEIVVLGETESSYEIGELIQTFTAFGIDVLQENVYCTMTVTDPLGEIVRDVNDVLLSNVPADIVYTLKLEQYGNYHIRYTATDAAGRKTNRNLLYYVSDMELPTITVSGKYFQCKINEEVALPKMVVSDNVTPIEELMCYLMYKDPNGRTYLIETTRSGDTVSASFKFNQVGKWTITYLVYDNNFNVATYDISVFVEE